MPRRSTTTPSETSSAPDVPSVVIREQITQMAPLTREELDNAPENTDTQDVRPRGPNGRLLRADGTERARRNMSGSRRARSQPNTDPLMDDPRYVEAIQGLNFYGAPRVIKRGFKAAGTLMKDGEIPLTSDEERHVDNYFYALSKHMTFDPMAHLIGRIILFVLLMGELIMWRYLKYSPLGKQLKKMLEESGEEKEDDRTPVM